LPPKPKAGLNRANHAVRLNFSPPAVIGYADRFVRLHLGRANPNSPVFIDVAGAESDIVADECAMM
jgi:hypothetical protein